MPLTNKGEEILSNMEKQYGSEAKAKGVLYASKNKGTITGIDSARSDAQKAYLDSARRGDAEGLRQHGDTLRKR